MNSETTITDLKERTLQGYRITKDEALMLSNIHDKEALYQAAGELRDAMTGTYFDTCSIINARSKKCSEDCKWCAQSTLYDTGVDAYELIDEKECLEMAKRNAAHGINKFSFVTSGRALSDKNIDILCGYYERIRKQVPIKLCASMGLLTKEQLLKLKKVGIMRYHCNLETSRNHFPNVCTTHTFDEKIATIHAVQEAGMEVCSGGIIGMGETMEDRIDMVLTLRELNVKSIPVNILNPVPGTPLEGTPPLTDEDILTTIAVFRFIHPDAYFRFAGGKTLITHIEEKAIKAGINSSIMGGMLTMAGTEIEKDVEKINKLGYVLDDKAEITPFWR
ncbi:hypothetical protein FACS1894121_1360 [Bacteroidia bacterium]|nr:hypothetical protein FACS1894121_1360 [Bacteroidia bacterium]GHV64345.1 hypothetical protein FACS1894199_02380 [Bacteroidia bacterium]